MTNNAEARAREVLAAEYEANAPMGKYVASDILRSCPNPQHDRAIAAMLAYGNERAAQEREANAAIASEQANIIALRYDDYPLAEQLSDIPAPIRARGQQ